MKQLVFEIHDTYCFLLKNNESINCINVLSPNNTGIEEKCRQQEPIKIFDRKSTGSKKSTGNKGRIFDSYQ